MAKNVGGHLGAPEPGLVSKVDARFQHVAHGMLHDEIPSMIWVGTHAPLKFRGKSTKHPWIPVRALRYLPPSNAGVTGDSGRFTAPLPRT
jgi:hypothetical protein